MGDRANIKFQEENGGTMYFYTHWHGFDYMKQALMRALAKKVRWDDDSYLARMIFCEVVKADIESSTGFGLSTQLYDNEHPIIVVDIRSQSVTIGDDSPMSFEEFITS